MRRGNAFKTALLGMGLSLFMVGGAQAAAFILSPPPTPGDALNIKFGGYTTEVPGVPTGNSGGRETTWGVGYVTEIDNHSTGDTRIWDGNGANPQNSSVDFILYGIADTAFISGAPGTLRNTGCTVGPGCDGKIHIDFYLFDGTDPVRGNSITPASRTGFNSVVGISNVGTPLMNWVLVPGDINNTGDATNTLIQSVNASVLPTTGNGNFLADCVSGPACSLFADHQMQLNGLTSFFGDIRGAFTLQTCTTRQGHPEDCPDGRFPNGFAGFINDPAGTIAAAAAVPEPASLLILGAGMLLMGGFASRKSRMTS